VVVAAPPPAGWPSGLAVWNDGSGGAVSWVVAGVVAPSALSLASFLQDAIDSTKIIARRENLMFIELDFDEVKK
jgi:hypothetical protein